MSDSGIPAEPTKKRKRTGKEREERKKAAIQAKLEAETDAKAETPPIIADTDATISNVGAVEEPKSLVDLEQLEKRIPQALKTLHPLIKQAKSFEVRRLVKKIKFLRTKPDGQTEVGDLEAQLSLLTHYEIHNLAKSHLLLKLQKHPLFKTNPLPSHIASLLTTPTNASASTSLAPNLVDKVENRLCSAKTVSEGIKGVVTWLVGVEGAKLPTRAKSSNGIAEGGPKRKARVTRDDEDEEGDESAEDIEQQDSFPSEKGRAGLVARPIAEQSEDEGGFEEESGDEQGWESGSISSTLPPTEPSTKKSKPNAPAQIAIPPPKVKAKPKPKAKPETGPITASTFLPSLSTGFTLGSDDEDDTPFDEDAGEVPERKNRRGQRARQAIWEKKFGKNAKHVVKAAREDKASGANAMSAETGTGVGRGGFGGAGRGGAIGRGGVSMRGGLAPRDAPPHVSERPVGAAVPVTANTNSGGPALHPSWEAARLRKKKETEAAPKATKIVFD